MTSEGTTTERRVEFEETGGLFAKLMARVRHLLAAVEEHCETVERAKEVGERENLGKHGKDWVNRCCG